MHISLDRPERAGFYGCIDPPFSLAPDSRFFYAGDSHRPALDALQQTLAENHTFVIVTGDQEAAKRRCAAPSSTG